MPSPVSLAVVAFALVHAVAATSVATPWIALAVTAMAAMPATSFTAPGSVTLFKQLYDACNGAKWFQCNTKLADPCSCSTITCNINGTIAKLSLSFNNLQAATFPSGIVDAFIAEGATLVDFSGNPQLGIVNSQPACFPVPECLSSPKVACFFDRPVCTSSPTTKDGKPTPKATATPKPVTSAKPVPSPTKKPVKAPSAPTTAGPTASPHHAVFVTSGGFVPEGTQCQLPFTDKASGQTFTSCAPFHDDNKLPWTGGQPYRQPLPPVSNATWCYTGISEYSITNTEKRKQWGFCGKLAVTAAPALRPVAEPTTPQPTPLPTPLLTPLPTKKGATSSPSFAAPTTTAKPTKKGTSSPSFAAPTTTAKPTPLPTKKGATSSPSFAAPTTTTKPTTTAKPTAKPTKKGATSSPSFAAPTTTAKPTKKGAKSKSPTSRPTLQPSPFPTKKGAKTKSPTHRPVTLAPTKPTTKSPTHKPQKKTESPTGGEYEYEGVPTAKPTPAKTSTAKPTAKVTKAPSSAKPSKPPTPKPSKRSPTKPTTHAPTPPPVNGTTHSPAPGEYEYEGESTAPTHRPTPLATQTPTKKGQTRVPTQQPTSAQPSRVPTKTDAPVLPSTRAPHTKSPTEQPTAPTAFDVFFTSGGYASENTRCHFPFKDAGVTYTSCAPATGAANHPYVGATDKPRAPVNASVTNATWCFTGTAAAYDGTNSAIRKDWGYCGFIVVGNSSQAPSAAPSARPTALTASAAPSSVTSAPAGAAAPSTTAAPSTAPPGTPTTTNAPANILPPTTPPPSSSSAAVAARWQAPFITIVAAAATAMAVCV